MVRAGVWAVLVCAFLAAGQTAGFALGASQPALSKRVGGDVAHVERAKGLTGNTAAGPSASSTTAAVQAIDVALTPKPPETAAARALVVGVTFPGTTPIVPLSHFQSVFFGPGPRSVASYLLANSYGSFHLHGTVVGGSAAGQAGDWLEVPHSIAYYAQGNSGMGKASEGDNGGTSGGDILEQQVVHMLDKAHFNWTPYEDASGNVPYLILLVNSPDAALTGSNSQLWSYEESQSNTPIVLPNGKKAMILNYDLDAAAGPDAHTLNGVGTYDHEFSHMLGAIDLYDSNGNIAGLADWSLMGAGNYNGPENIGSEPSFLDAFTRLQFGWSQATVINGPPVLYLVPPAERSRVVLGYRIPGTHQDYLMENRQPIGSDAWLPGHGLLIYRIDTKILNPNSAAWQNDCVECVTGKGKNPHPGIVIMQSDGTQSLSSPGSAGDNGSNGDPFPGSTGNTAFSDTTRPSAKGFEGQPSYLSVYGITQEANGNIELAAGNIAASLSPSRLPAAGGTVTVTDPLAAFGQGDAINLVGAPANTVSGVNIVNATTATFQVAANTPAGAYLVQGTSPSGVQTPLAYLVVTAGATSRAPAGIRLRATTTPLAGHPTPVHVTVVDAKGNPVTGDYGPVWVDGVPVTMTGGTGTTSVTSNHAGSLSVTAAMYRLPSIVGSTTLQVAAAAPAQVNIAGPATVVAGTAQTYRVEAADRFGNPVSGDLPLQVAGHTVKVRLRRGIGEVRVLFRRAGPTNLSDPQLGARAGSLNVSVSASAPAAIRSSWTPREPVVGQEVKISAIAHDAYGNLASGRLVLGRMTRTLVNGRALYSLVFRSPGVKILQYDVASRAQVRIQVLAHPPVNYWG